MKKDHSDQLRSILEEIKSKTITKGNITEYRDVHKIWELGLLIQEIIGDSKNPNELKKKIVRNYDWKILGKPKSESDYAYDWVTNFEDKNYFLKICKYAGFREGNKNRFRKRDLRYLVGIYSKITKSTLTDAKRKKLELKTSSQIENSKFSHLTTGSISTIIHLGFSAVAFAS